MRTWRCTNVSLASRPRPPRLRGVRMKAIPRRETVGGGSRAALLPLADDPPPMTLAVPPFSSNEQSASRACPSARPIVTGDQRGLG
jgi:hypothetical protein